MYIYINTYIYSCISTACYKIYTPTIYIYIHMYTLTHMHAFTWICIICRKRHFWMREVCNNKLMLSRYESCVRVCVNIYIYIYAHTHTHVLSLTHTHTFICVQQPVDTLQVWVMGVYVCVCVYTYIYTYTHTHLYAHAHTHSFIGATWLIYKRDMTHSNVRHESFICVTWPIHMCTMTHSHASHDSFTCVTWRMHICHNHVDTHEPCLYGMAWHTMHVYMKWHVSNTWGLRHGISCIHA